MSSTRQTATPAARAVALPSRADVLAASRRLGGRLHPTPTVRSPGAGGALKLETVHPTGSFKVRGALAALTLLDRRTPVVTASAGNHGLGVAWAAGALGLRAAVVVPETASPAKRAALLRLPVELIEHGPTYDEAEAHALWLASDRGARYVSPYNDPDVIAGQGTVALELEPELAPGTTVVCPIGGGGLCSGVALWLSSRRDVRVVGVETEASSAMRAALDAGAITTVDVRPTVADGLGGNLEPGSVTFELVRRHVDDVVVVTEAAVEEAIAFLSVAHGLVVEGAGAVAVAAVRSGLVDRSAGPVVALVTGRNIDPARHAGIVVRNAA